MKHQPLRRYRTPGYPTKLEVSAHRDLLEEHWPEAWSKCVKLAGVAGLLLAAGGCHERGLSGCLVVVPPAFLSEEEALQVIVEEIGQAGVDISDTNVTLDELTVRYESEPLEVDGWSETSNVAFEFVSRSDWPYYREIHSVAESLNEQVAESRGRLHFRAFYDPLTEVSPIVSEGTDPQEQWEQATLTAKDGSKRLLREQVADFVDWLKAQGAI